jgi:hypothetical protein
MVSVLQKWVEGLSFKQQTVVLCVLRGCDGQPKEDLSKLVVRYIRKVVLKNAGTDKTPFMSNIITLNDIIQMSRDLDKYPVHYVMHLIFACEIIGFKHPDSNIREFFNSSYKIMVGALHLKPETEEECDDRLKDGVDTR